MVRTVAWVHDLWLPVALTAVALVEANGSHAGLPGGAPAVLSVLLPMAWVTVRRRHQPVLVAAAVVVLVVVLVLGIQTDLAQQPPLTGFLALLASLFALGVHGAGRHFVLGAGLVGATLLGLQVGSAVAGQSLDDVIPSSLFLAGAFALGRLLHRTRTEATEARDRARLAEERRDHEVARATEQERARIARELHDVLAHSLSVMVVQSSVEARLQEDQDSTAVATLRSVERLGRDAMTELRRLLGMLREEGQGPADAPLPSLSALESLTESLQNAGHEVRLERHGDLDAVPPGVALAAYRLLQEALTNVARHASGASVRVVVAREPDAVHVVVENAPARGALPALDSAGAGLTGMHERVRLYDGRLRAEPRPDGGFVVEACLPLDRAWGEVR